MSRWWAVALLSLSVGLNLGLAVAVVQQRLAPAPQPLPPTVVVMPSPAVAAPVESIGSTSPPVPVNEVAPAPVTVASPLGAAPPQQRTQQRPQSPREAPAEEPLVPLEEAFDLGPPDGHDAGGPGPGGPGAGGPRGGGPSPARLDELARRLGVPERDRPRFVESQLRFLAEARTRRIQLETVRQGLRGELTAPQPDTARLHSLVDASARLQGALERAFVDHVLQAREILDGEAEQRYLKFLARLGPRAVAGMGPPPGQGRPLDPRWQRDRPWGGRGGGLGGGRRPPPPGGPGGRFQGPAPAPSPH